MKCFTRVVGIAAGLLILLPMLVAQVEPVRPDDASANGSPPSVEPEKVQLPPPRVTFKCVRHHNTSSSVALPTDNAMMSFMDKGGNLYVALRSDTTHEGKEIRGGLFVLTSTGKTYLYNKKSNPPIPTNSVEHAWKDDKGLLYVATGDAGLALIDTRGTPEKQSDDTVRVYTVMGVTDVTKQLDAKPFSHAPSIGCDHVVYSWMDPGTRDLLICAGGIGTYKGGLTVLVYDKEKGEYTRSYTYRALNYRVGRTKRKFFEAGVFDTTQCYQPDRKYLPLTGGKAIKHFKPLTSFGKNHFCYRAFRDNSTGLIYVARRDTVDADKDAVMGANGDGGLTIIDTKKTADPKDDEVRVLDTSSTPALAASDVYDVRLEAHTGKIYVSTGDMMSVQKEQMYGLVIIDKKNNAVTYRKDGKFDTTASREGKLIDEKSSLHSGFVLGTLRDKATGDLLVLQMRGIDVIHKDGFVSRIPWGKIIHLPVTPENNCLWAIHGWIDDKGLLYLCTGEMGGLGLLVLEMVETPE